MARTRALSTVLQFALGALATLWLACMAPAVQAGSVEIRAALAGTGHSAAFPVDGPVRLVTLPDDWARSWPGHDGTVWYRVQIERIGTPPLGDLPALFVEHVCSNFEVHVNGQLVHSGGRMNLPYAHNCDQPQLVALPSTLLRQGNNQIDLRVAGHALAEVGSRWRAGSLSEMAIGPQSELADRHARLTALRVTIPQALSATLLLMGGFMFVLGFINRHESHLAYFGALAVAWALIDTRLWLRTLPISHSVAEFLVCTLLGVVTWAAVQFLLRYAGERHRVVDIGMPLQCALLALTLLAAGPGRLHIAASGWGVLMALQVVAAAAWYLHRRRGSRGFWLMVSLLGTAGLAVAIDSAAQWRGVRPLAADLARLGLPLLMVVLGLRLVQQHGRARHQAEQMKLQLEQRVREATAEIEHNFRQLAELRVEQVTERERKRIAADLHDDLGAKLLTIVHTSESERISTLAREALEEMRLSVRGLTGKPVRLADALGDWRAEIVSRLAQAGIEGDWEAPEDLPQTLSARAYVQTTRILREATSNIIKHSGATHCSVKAGLADGDFQLVVQDNGDGIPDQIDGRLDRGHGLASMKNRAKALQGQCLVESGPGYGTVIRLTLPLDRAIETS
jgi:two-component system sensor histidine kinase UhpB